MERPRRAPRPALLGLLVVGALLGACAEGERTERVERVVLRVLDRAEGVRVLAEAPGAPVGRGWIAPARSPAVAPSLPALRMPPPARVEVRLPPLPPGATLHVSYGVDVAAHEEADPGERAAVRFTVRREGEVAVEAAVALGAGAGSPERGWHEAALAVAGGERIELETRAEAGAAGAPAGFARLEVRAPREVVRSRATAAAPSVVLVVVDTLRADALHVYGHRSDHTPALDALAARGTLFERAYAPAPWTLPSTATLMTGLDPAAHGAVDAASARLAGELPTLAEAFAATGARTAAFSTNPLVTAAAGFDRGFETFVEREWAPAAEVVDGALAWLHEAGGDRAFLYLHLTDPHTPYDPPADLLERWAPTLPDDAPIGTSWHAFLAELEGLEPAEAERQKARYVRLSRVLYDGEVAGVDRELGRLLAALEGRGLAGTTVVAVTSDHGEEFFEHGLYGHAKQLFEETLRVPLLLAGPGVPCGARVEGPVALADLPATLLALAGVEPRGVGGGSLLAPAAGRSGAPVSASTQPVFASTHVGTWVDQRTGEVRLRDGVLRAVLADRQRLVVGEGGLEALYDLAEDPAERTDVAPQRPAEVARLRAAIEAWEEAGRRVRPAEGDLGANAAAEALMRGLGYLDG